MASGSWWRSQHQVGRAEGKLYVRSSVKAVLLAACLFIAVYLPAFAIKALLRPTITVAVPLVIGISLFISLALMIALSKRERGLAEFGFRLPQQKYVYFSLIFGALLGLVIGYVAHLFPTRPPHDVSTLAPVLIVSYFVLGASVQEEVIFRGLLQTTVARAFSGSINVLGLRVGADVLVIAALFCLIHVPEGPAVAIRALILGLGAGELRKRSGSLVPAILVHLLFNLDSGIFALGH